MPRQVFIITRAPEEPALTANELRRCLYWGRLYSEWEVVEKPDEPKPIQTRPAD